jgi:hypothetical protein
MSDFAETYARHHEAVAHANTLNKAVVFDALATAGITHVFVKFDGEGDSGQTESALARADDKPINFPNTIVKFHTAPWGQTELSVKETWIRTAVEDLCYGYLEQTHAGWVNNYGAYGEFTFDVAERKITLDFNERITDTSSTAHTF